MKKALTISVLLVVATSLSGCGMFPDRKVRTHVLEPNSTTVVSYAADRRGTYFQNGTAAGSYCAEPAPDVALDSVAKLGMKITAEKAGNADLNTELSIKVVELAGRTQTVLLARELLYRACEMNANGALPDTEVVEQYKAVIALVKDLGQTDLKKAEAKKLMAEAAHVKALKASGKIMGELEDNP